MATDDVIQLAVRARYNAQQIVGTYALRNKVNSTINAALIQTQADFIKNTLRNQQSNLLVYEDWRAILVRGAGTTYNITPPFRVVGSSWAAPFSGTLPGALTGPPAPQQVAAIASHSTNLAGRRYRGRTYFCGLTESDIDDDGLLTPAQVANLNTVFANIRTGINGSTEWEYGLWSDRIAMNVAYSNTWPRVLTSQGAPNPTAAFTAITATAVKRMPGSQRDRRPGIGV